MAGEIRSLLRRTEQFSMLGSPLVALRGLSSSPQIAIVMNYPGQMVAVLKWPNEVNRSSVNKLKAMRC